MTWFCATIVSWIRPSKRSFKLNGKVPLKSWKVLLTVHISWQGTLHASRVNGFRLKKYHARLMMVQKDEELVDDMEILQDDATVDAGSFASLFLAADHE